MYVKYGIVYDKSIRFSGLVGLSPARGVPVIDPDPNEGEGRKPKRGRKADGTKKATMRKRRVMRIVAMSFLEKPVKWGFLALPAIHSVFWFIVQIVQCHSIDRARKPRKRIRSVSFPRLPSL